MASRRSKMLSAWMVVVRCSNGNSNSRMQPTIMVVFALVVSVLSFLMMCMTIIYIYIFVLCISECGVTSTRMHYMIYYVHVYVTLSILGGVQMHTHVFSLHILRVHTVRYVIHDIRCTHTFCMTKQSSATSSTMYRYDTRSAEYSSTK